MRGRMVEMLHLFIGWRGGVGEGRLSAGGEF
jgi:hypothetical protein